MSVEFDADSRNSYQGSYESPKRSAVSSFLISIGVAKNESGANLIAGILAVIVFIAAIWLFMSQGSSSNVKTINNGRTPKPPDAIPQ